MRPQAELKSAPIETPLILQKSDGTSLYATREIATAEYRIEHWHPEKMLYVVGKKQKLYFRQFGAALAKLGINVPCVHVTFGLVRLPEGRMSTREGRVVFLEDVVAEAVRRAEAVVQDRDLSPEEKGSISRIVGIGAIKYADLSQSRIKEVVFDWNRMLALDGDSAPYLQYAYTRTRSILKKSEVRSPKSFVPGPSSFVLPEEVTLLKSIARATSARRWLAPSRTWSWPMSCRPTSRTRRRRRRAGHPAGVPDRGVRLAARRLRRLRAERRLGHRRDHVRRAVQARDEPRRPAARQLQDHADR